MGSGRVYSCTRCGDSLRLSFGVGFRFPTLYQETMEEAKNGELGDNLQQFVLNHPEGALSCVNRIVRCKKCRNVACVRELNMYLPKDGFDPASLHHDPWSLADFDFDNEGFYVTPEDLCEYYKLAGIHLHHCEKCGAPAGVISEQTLVNEIASGSVVCPRCGGDSECRSRHDFVGLRITMDN